MLDNITIEDCLEILAGYHKDHTVSPSQLDKSDVSLIQSLGRQVLRGTALTDRQFDLASKKCYDYVNILNAFDITDSVFKNLRMPLREIDRSRWIKIVDDLGSSTPYKADTAPFIAVRFTFAKKLIDVIDTLRLKELHYDKKTKIHYYPYNERMLFDIVTLLQEKNFEIEENIQTIYKELLHMNNNKNNYVPGIYGLKLRNFTNKAIDVMVKDIGEPTQKNLPLYADRQKLYGVDHIDDDNLTQSVQGLSILTKKIISRNSTQIFINKGTYNYNMLVESLLELLRWPILVVCNNKFVLDDIQPINESFKGIFASEDSTVLFRETNDTAEGQEINNFIKDKRLNNQLDTNTKVVYIKGDKIPKPLVSSDWTPRVIILAGSKISSQKTKALANEVDLVIHYDTDVSPFHRGVQKI